MSDLGVVSLTLFFPLHLPFVESGLCFDSMFRWYRLQDYYSVPPFSISYLIIDEESFTDSFLVDFSLNSLISRIMSFLLRAGRRDWERWLHRLLL